MVIDKHAPSFIACAKVKFLKVLLDGYHGYHAFSDYMTSKVKVSKISEAVSFLDLAHRLYSRSSSTAQAEIMFKEFVKWVTSEDTSHLWTDKQVQHIVTYFGKYWHNDVRVRNAWIDEGYMWARFELLIMAFASTGSSKGSH
jgi:hypothetical protein